MGVSLLKPLHIFVEHLCRLRAELTLCVGIVAITDLQNQLVERLLLFSRPYLVVIIAYPSVRARLLCVVLFKCLAEQLLIYRLYIFATIAAVQMTSFGIGVLGVKYAPIMSNRAFSYFCAYRSFYNRTFLSAARKGSGFVTFAKSNAKALLTA